MKSIVLASNNLGKIREIQSLLGDTRFRVLSQSEMGVPEAEETGSTFIENAIIKARNACRYAGLPAISDDSGLEVDALDGAPGVYSARYAGVDATDENNNLKLLSALKDVADDQRRARFRCVAVFMRSADDPSPVVAQGVWEGVILHQSRGVGGFGYDPLFLVPDLGCSSAELHFDQKNVMSHRGKAFRSLAAQILEA